MYLEFLAFILGIVVGLLGGFIYLTKLQIKQQATQSKMEASSQQLTTNQIALERSQEGNIALIKTVATLETKNKELKHRLEEHQQSDKATQEKLLLQFNKLSNDLLERNSQKFTLQNKTQIEHLLKPLSEKITTFEQQVTRTHEETLARNVALRTELEKITTLNLQMTREAENLTNAIKGDTKVQGNWGEFILESLLEKSGLVKDREYFVQDAFTTEDGKRYRPDVVIKLPEEKSIIIDAKVSLLHYEKFFNTSNPKEKQEYLKKHINSIKNHIKGLSNKNYAQEYDLQGLDFVLMFIPIEPAFLLAIQHERKFFNDAYQQNIVPVSPSTLMATLRTIAHVWKSEHANQNALEIAHQSGALYDKFVGFVDDLKKLGNQLATTQKTYDSSIKKLSEGKGNLINKAQKIKALGARTSKTLTLN